MNSHKEKVWIATILDKINGKPRPPPPPQIKDGKMARFCPLRTFILDLGGDGGLLFHFILSKIVGRHTYLLQVVYLTIDIKTSVFMLV